MIEEPIETISVSGFDPLGEPELRLMPDGRLYARFQRMPPSWAEYEAAPFDAFERVLEKVIGTRVIREERTLFMIPLPTLDAVERLVAFLIALRNGI